MLPLLDETRFSDALNMASAFDGSTEKVGTLSEKLVHRTLKYYFEPDGANHEIEVLGSIVDIKNGDGIVEIQTRGFDRLKPKLEKLLPEYSVKVVYPVIVEKTVHWIDPESGETVSVRKSSKKGRVTDILPELYHVLELLREENLSFTLVSLCADEFRILDGYGKEKKKRATKVNIVPTKLLEVRDVSGNFGVKEWIYSILPDNFTAKQLNSTLHLRPRQLSLALKFLIKLGVVRQIGKICNAYLYEKIK